MQYSGRFTIFTMIEYLCPVQNDAGHDCRPGVQPGREGGGGGGGEAGGEGERVAGEQQRASLLALQLYHGVGQPRHHAVQDNLAHTTFYSKSVTVSSRSIFIQKGEGLQEKSPVNTASPGYPLEPDCVCLVRARPGPQHVCNSAAYLGHGQQEARQVPALHHQPLRQPRHLTQLLHLAVLG